MTIVYIMKPNYRKAIRIKKCTSGGYWIICFFCWLQLENKTEKNQFTIASTYQISTYKSTKNT